MNKKQFIDAVSTKMKEQGINYPKWELISIIDPALDTILEVLSHNEEVHLNNFGRFTIKHKKGTLFYNMNTGQREIGKDKKIIQFTPCKDFHFDDTSDLPASDNPDIEKEGPDK